MGPSSHLKWILAGLVMALSGQVLANQDFVSVVTGEIVAQGWDPSSADALATGQELSFMLHYANGSMAARLESFGRYAGDQTLQTLIGRHPAWLDLFLTLRQPDEFASALDAFSGDQDRREILLEAMLLNPGPDGLKEFERVVIAHGDVLAHLADVPEFGSLISELIFVGREGSTPDFTQWLHKSLAATTPEDVEWMTLLLAQHGTLLRHEIDIELRWERLMDAGQRNPDLRDLLTSHLDIWNHLDNSKLIDVVSTQLNLFGQDKAQLVLIFLLGYENALDSISVPQEWGKSLRGEYADWSMDQLLQDSSSPTVEAAFHFRNDDRFWSFARREGIIEQMPCLLARFGSDISQMQTKFERSAEQLRPECNKILADWIPGSDLAQLAQKAWHGTPLETGDMIWAAVDLADATVTLVTFGSGKIAVPAFRGGILAARGLRGAEVAEKLARGGKVASSVVKAEILEVNIARRATNTLKPGLSRILNMNPEQIIKPAMNRAQGMPEHLRHAVEDMTEEAAGEAGGVLIENALTTEFIRCAGIASLSAQDPVCQALFPPEPKAAP